VVGNAGYPGYDEPGVRDLADPADLLCDLKPGLDRRGGREAAASASTQNPRVEMIKYSFQKIFSLNKQIDCTLQKFSINFAILVAENVMSFFRKGSSNFINSSLSYNLEEMSEVDKKPVTSS
jgi:hypothetical protein